MPDAMEDRSKPNPDYVNAPYSLSVSEQDPDTGVMRHYHIREVAPTDIRIFERDATGTPVDITDTEHGKAIKRRWVPWHLHTVPILYKRG